MPRQIAAGTTSRSPIASSITSMENLLDLELTDRLEVGAGGPRFGDDGAVLVRQLADRLGAAGIDTENVDHVSRGKRGRHYP